MPIASASITSVEIVTQATAAAAGSNAKATYNVFTYTRGTTVNPISKTNVKNGFVTLVVTPLLAAMNIRYALNNITVRWINDALDAPQSFPQASVGAIATDSLPVDTAIAMLLRTNLRGKNYRGSKHFGPGSEADTTGDVLTGAGLVRWQAVQTAVAAAYVDADGNTWTPAVLSRTLSQLMTNPTVVIVNNVNQVLLNTNIGTMRHRRVRTTR